MSRLAAAAMLLTGCWQVPDKRLAHSRLHPHPTRSLQAVCKRGQRRPGLGLRPLVQERDQDHEPCWEQREDSHWSPRATPSRRCRGNGHPRLGPSERC